MRFRIMQSTRPVYVISVAAEICGLHPRTLRIYEEKGLLTPVRRNRIRLYSDSDIERVRLIRQLIEHHRLNLAGVRLVLEMLERLQTQVGALERDNDVEQGKDGDVVRWLVERLLEGEGGRGR
ncbi:MAG: MerR family transcriptional regulator [Armatimonadota bacterium]|nr:MerR family transcriptional regulator [Armatimonadota bacterium]MDR7536843.1 MerR family transcriptional regulator [Armatimonadota bacterium]